MDYPPCRADDQCLEVESPKAGGVDGLQLRGAGAGVPVRGWIFRRVRRSRHWFNLMQNTVRAAVKSHSNGAFLCACAKFSSLFVLG